MSYVQQSKHAQKFFFTRVFPSIFNTCYLVHLLSMELVPCKLFNMLTIFESFYRMFETARECTLKNKRDLVCSKITSSENATSKNLLQSVMNPQCNCEKQEYQKFHSITTMIYSTSTISANVGVSLKKAFSKLVLKHFTHHLAVHIHS